MVTPKSQASTRAAKKVDWNHVEGSECQAEWFPTDISGCGDPVRNCKRGSDRIRVVSQEM